MPLQLFEDGTEKPMVTFVDLAMNPTFSQVKNTGKLIPCADTRLLVLADYEID